ncbi:MAG: hypothetical protein B6U89_06345 [Desulfurococcales archaeon ex4484_58]|nr:MAG: hypothetical protein B6U89_06345 [Desulfurococcales archaeon ex4484_58]
MACFLVPLGLGVILAIVKKLVKNISTKLDLLIKLLLGGSFILAIEHLWHGEIVPWPPFLTAMNNPAEIPVMINEMLINGTLMSITIISIWISTQIIKNYLIIKHQKTIKTSQVEL